MITWMQRHKKYLIITIWISTIAFVGAGFVGWGQYSYGDKAGAVAKVGNIEITMGELQKSYSRLYAQYNQVFQGNFDEEKAKSFGLQSQALNQLTNQALILNLAASYDLRVSDAELLASLMAQEAFLQDGSFNKDIYKETLSRNNLNTKEYEADLRKQLLIQKVLELLPVEASGSETKILNTLNNIADKLEYKVLDDTNISVSTSDAELKPYWETRQQEFMNEVSYELKYFKQEKITKEHSQEKINTYYAENKNHFKNDEAKIMSLEESRSLVLDELNAKATKDMALRNYIAYKKRKLSDDIELKTAVVSQANNPFTQEALDKIEKLSITSPFLKPIEINGVYYTFELIKIHPSTVKTFEEAKEDLIPMFIADKKREKLFDLVKNSLDSFKGEETDFITNADADKITDLSIEEANEFLTQLFTSNTKKGSISLKNGKVVLYNILEQKMLENTNESADSIANLKSSIFSSGLIRILNAKYKTEIFIQGQ
ncbi:MAG: SurA N-terminal domain-containing protein [Helicobacteraceae bacterium]|nr:SurA N-terminal domain-containing protein [Candidatus Sulfurimonas ponti]MBL6973946.1 SurA N-terminal domain-containing protein [Sulfurimonas sp.]